MQVLEVVAESTAPKLDYETLLQNFETNNFVAEPEVEAEEEEEEQPVPVSPWFFTLSRHSFWVLQQLHNKITPHVKRLASILSD